MSTVSALKPKPASIRPAPDGVATAVPRHEREPNSAAARMPFEQAAAMVLGQLQHALADLLAAAPTEIRKIADVERAFGVNHLLGWQVYRIVQAQNPLAAGMHVPARVSIKKLLTAAARRRVPADVIDRVSEAFEQFEQLVESDAGDREELEAMLNAFLPEERRKHDLGSRQAAFKGMSQIRGLATEVVTATLLLRPSSDGQTADSVLINGLLGLRKVRPDARIVSWYGSVSKPDLSVFTLDGTPNDGPLASLLPQFSTSPLPRFETRKAEGISYYSVAGKEVGMRSAIDLVMADRRSAGQPLFWTPGQNRVRGGGYVIDKPAKRGTLDVFLHKDVWPGVPPQLAVYDTAARGIVSRFDDPAREDDRLVSHDEVRALPAGLAGARMPHVPRYVELLEHVYEKLGWNPSDFRGYRLDVQYPVYGAEYMIGFEPPEAPAQ